MNNFHNTIRLQGEKLQHQIQKCKNQEEAVLLIFKKHSKNKDKFTASEIFTILNINSPITSIRRAISNLKHAQKLHKLNETKKGIYGMPEHYYKLV